MISREDAPPTELALHQRGDTIVVANALICGYPPVAIAGCGERSATHVAGRKPTGNPIRLNTRISTSTAP